MALRHRAFKMLSASVVSKSITTRSDVSVVCDASPVGNHASLVHAGNLLNLVVVVKFHD